MEDELVDINTILEWLKDQVKNKKPIPPERYLDASVKLNILRSDDNDKLMELEYQLAVKRSDYINKGATAAAAKIYIEALPIYVEIQKLKYKLKQVEEAIKLGKLYSRIKNDELNSARFGNH